MIRAAHIIQRLIVDLRVRASTARDAQSRWEGLWESTVAPVVEQVCDELASGQDLIVLDRVYVDLGVIAERLTETEIRDLLRESLRRELAEAIASALRPGEPSSTASSGTVTTEPRVLYFLRTGVLPWWSEAPAAGILASELLELVEKADERTASWLERHGKDARIIRRTFQQFGPRRAAELTAVLVTIAGARDRVPVELSIPTEDLSRLETLTLEEMEAVWELWSDRKLSLSEKGSRLTEILARSRTSRRPADSARAPTRPTDATTKDPGEPSPVGERSPETVDPARVEPLSAEKPHRRQPAKARDDEPQRAAPAAPGRPRGCPAGTVVPDPGGEEESIEEPSSERGQKGPASQSTEASASDIESPAAEAGRSPRSDPVSIHEEHEATETSPVDGGEHTPRESAHRPQPEEPVESAPARARPQDVPGAPKPADSASEWGRVDGEGGASPREGIAIDNAGLVILWPFVPRLFERVSLRQEGVWVSEESPARAVHLLQFLAAGEGDRPEFELVLNKILCGLPIDDPVPLDVELSSRERGEGELLLEQVVAHWTALKQTSVRGLRLGFLARRGLIEAGETEWIAAVERETRDVLLEKLPWGLARFRFSWMDRGVEVRW